MVIKVVLFDFLYSLWDKIIRNRPDASLEMYLHFRELRKKDGKNEISVSSFEYLAKVLSIAGSDRKMGETRACLESKYECQILNYLKYLEITEFMLWLFILIVIL